MGPLTLECRQVTKTFGGVRAVADVSVTFHAGRINAVIGPNGAGKTTLFHLVGGALRPDSGQILCAGRRIEGQPVWSVARAGVGRLFQDVRLFRRLTVLENCLLAFPRQRGEIPFWSLLRPDAVIRQERAMAEQAREWLARLGLGGLESAPADALSFGQQKLLGIARLACGGSRVLLLDEPTAGISPKMIRLVMDMVHRLAADGKLVVMIEHDMHVVREHAQTICFMIQGRILASGSTEQILSDPAIRAAYLGMKHQALPM